MPAMPIKSPADLNTRFEVLRPKISQAETEDSWEVICKNLKALADLCQNGGACEFPAELITIIRSISRPITNSLITERTRLSSVAIDLISVLATGLGKPFKPLLQVFLPTLLLLCGRTNKVIVTRAKACIMIIIETTQISAIISYFVQSIEDKSTSIRLAAAEGTLTCVNCFNPPDLEKDVRAGEVETIIRAAAKDPQADIRVIGRKLFEAYKVLLPKRVESFTGPLSPTTKKYLDIKSAPTLKLEEASHAVAVHAKKQFSSSTSAISSTHSRTQSAHPVIHTRSVSSSMPVDRREKTTSTSTKAPTTSLRQKTEMLPPAFIPIRPSTKTLSMTRSTSAADIRARVVSTTLPSRAGATTESHQPHNLPVRPNSATSHREMPQRLHPQPLTMPGPFGPRRVPISGAGSNVRPQPPVVRSRVVSNPNAMPQPDKKVPTTRAPAPQVRAGERPGPNVKMRDPRPPSSSRALTTTDTSKHTKTSGVTQPTLSQISRAKATAERKQPNSTAPKPRGGRTIVKGASSSISRTEKGGVKSTETEVKKPVQPTAIPLPPSPTQSSTSENGEEPSSLTHEPAMTLQGEMVAPSEPTQSEDVTPSVTIQSPHEMDDKTGEGTVQHDHKEDEQEVERVAEDIRPLEEPTTPTLVSKDDIFDENAKTPISSLLASIQQGFMFTPSSPLSPPQSYVNRGMDMAIPFPLNEFRVEEDAREGIKPFMFGVGEGPTLSSVENLDLQK